MLQPAPRHADQTRGGSVRLVACERSHAPELLAGLADRAVIAMLAGVAWPPTLASVEARIDAQRDEAFEARDMAVLAGGRIVGCVTLKAPGRGDPPRTMPRLGYWIARPDCGRGHGSAAVAALVDMAFAQFPAHERIGAGVFADNAASLRLLGRLGFREAGRYDTRSLARGVAVETIDMNLARADYEDSRR